MSLSIKPNGVFSGIVPVSRTFFSSRLLLRRLSRSDAGDITSLFLKNREALINLFPILPKKITHKIIEKMIYEDQISARTGKRLDMGIFKNDSDEVIGQIALHTVEFGVIRSAGISYWVAQEYLKKGYATEALATLLAFAFEEVRLHRIWARIECSNISSQKLVERLGFRKEGTERKSLFLKGEWQDADLYALIEEEYDFLADSWINKGWLGY